MAEEPKEDSVNLFSKRSALASWDPFLAFLQDWQKHTELLRSDGKPYADLCFGQPQEAPLPKLTQAFQQQLNAPQTADTFAYLARVPSVEQGVATHLTTRRQLTVDPEDVFLTNGALAALNLAMWILANPGEEAILVSPIYFFYVAELELAQIKPVMVPTREDFDLDVEAIRAAITNKTRFLLLNSPNNPSGKIYPLETLQKLADVLRQVNQTREQPIYVVSDEAYNRIVFDNVQFHSITEVYPYTLMIYTWAKTLLCPGERFGYICLPKSMPEMVRLQLRDTIQRVQLAGWSKPNNTTALTYLQVEQEGLSIDLTVLQRRRNRLYDALTQQGWKVVKPEGTFYMLVQVDKELFPSEKELMAAMVQERALVFPGSVMAIPDYIRLSLTANDEMVDLAIEAFGAVRSNAKQEVEK